MPVPCTSVFRIKMKSYGKKMQSISEPFRYFTPTVNSNRRRAQHVSSFGIFATEFPSHFWTSTHYCCCGWSRKKLIHFSINIEMGAIWRTGGITDRYELHPFFVFFEGGNKWLYIIPLFCVCGAGSLCRGRLLFPNSPVL